MPDGTDVLIDLLRALNACELDMPEYNQGAWSRRNIEALIRDLEWDKARSLGQKLP